MRKLIYLATLLATMLTLSSCIFEDEVVEDATIQFYPGIGDSTASIALIRTTGASAPCLSDFSDWFFSDEAKGLKTVETIFFRLDSALSDLEGYTGNLFSSYVSIIPNHPDVIYKSDLIIKKSTSTLVDGDFDILDSMGFVQIKRSSFRARKCPDGTRD